MSINELLNAPYLNLNVGNLTAKNVTAPSQIITGNFQVDGNTTLNTLDVSGDTSLENLNISGVVDLSGNIIFDGSVDLSGNLIVAGNTSLDNLTVSGETSIESASINLPGLSSSSVVLIDNENDLAALTLNNGQLIIGSTNANPVASTLSSGSTQGVTIANSAGSIVLDTVQDIRTTASPSFANLNVSTNLSVGGATKLTGLSASSILNLDASNNISSRVLTNGQLLIGNTGNPPSASTLTQGSNNSVVISNNSGSITLDTAQDIRTSANPSFNNMTLNGTTLNLGPCSSAFTIQPQSAQFGSGNFTILAGAQTNGSNGQDFYIDSGVSSGGGQNGALLIGYNNARSVNVCNTGKTLTLGGTINTPLTANKLVITDNANNLTTATAPFPSRVTMWGDDRNVVAGNPLTFVVQNLQSYNGFAYSDTPAINDSTTTTFFCDAGTYALNFYIIKGSNQGIATVYLDGSNIGTIDSYNATPVYNFMGVITPVVISNYGRHLLQITIASKNASSSNYYFPITKISLIPATDTQQTTAYPF